MEGVGILIVFLALTVQIGYKWQVLNPHGTAPEPVQTLLQPFV